MYTSERKGRNNKLPQLDINSQARMNVNKVQGKSTMTSREPDAQIFIRLDVSNDTETTLQYMNANPERVTPYSCVAFVLTFHLTHTFCPHSLTPPLTNASLATSLSTVNPGPRPRESLWISDCGNRLTLWL